MPDMRLPVEKNLKLEETDIWNIIKNDHWEEYFRERLIASNINANMFVDKVNTSVRIVATNSAECENVTKLLCESIARQEVSPQDIAIIVQGEKCKNFFSELKQGQPLEIRFKESTLSIELLGVPDVVASAKQKVNNFFESERVMSEKLKVSEGIARLLTRHLSGKVNAVEKDLDQENVSIHIDQVTGEVEIQGTREGLTKCRKRLSELCRTIVDGNEDFSSHGACKLLLGENAKEHLKMIEMEQKVDIVVERCAKQLIEAPPLPPRSRTRKVDIVAEGCAKQPIEAPPLPPRSRTRLSSTLPKERIYNQCKFTTKDGVKVSWKYGSIEEEAVSLDIT